MRREGVGVNYTKVFKGGILKDRGENYTEAGPMKDQPEYTPALSTDSPHILFESRPKEFCTVNSANTAAQIFAGPHFMVCGIENKPPSAIDAPSITELSGYNWAKYNDDVAHKSNIFAIRDKKDLSACWAGSLPTLEGSIAQSDKTYNGAVGTFGLFGGQKTVLHGSQEMDGMEIFGTNMLIGAGAKIKNKNLWENQVFMGKDTVELSRRDKDKDISKIFMGTKKENKESIEIHIGDSDKESTGIFIEDRAINFKIQGKKVLSTSLDANGNTEFKLHVNQEKSVNISDEQIHFKNYFYFQEWKAQVKFVPSPPSKFGCF